MSRNEQPDLPPDFLARPDVEVFSIPEPIGLILHAHGGPLDRIAALLADLGVRRDAPSLKKAWRKMPYLRKTSDGRIALVPDEGEYTRGDHVLWEARKQFARASHRNGDGLECTPSEGSTCQLHRATYRRGVKSLQHKDIRVANGRGQALQLHRAAYREPGIAGHSRPHGLASVVTSWT